MLPDSDLDPDGHLPVVSVRNSAFSKSYIFLSDDRAPFVGREMTRRVLPMQDRLVSWKCNNFCFML